MFYDVLIAGGGLSGSLLAYYLSIYQPDLSVLVINQQGSKDKTISYWTQDSVFSDVAIQRYKQLRVARKDCAQTLFLPDYSFCMTSVQKLNKHIRTQVSANTKFVDEQILNIKPQKDSVTILTDKQSVKGRMVFDSTYEKIHHVDSFGMYVSEWEVQVGDLEINPEVAVFMDFADLDQSRYTQFFYVLPISRNQAVVQYARFAYRMQNPDWENLIRHYLTYKKLKNVRVRMRQHGFVPLTTNLVDSSHKRIIYIGGRRGLIKPTTGYGFTRFVNDAQLIAETLDVNEAAVLQYIPGRTYRLLDELFLSLLKNHPEKMPDVYTRLLDKDVLRGTLQFLDEDCSKSQLMRVILQVKSQVNLLDFVI